MFQDRYFFLYIKFNWARSVKTHDGIKSWWNSNCLHCFNSFEFLYSKETSVQLNLVNKTAIKDRNFSANIWKSNKFLRIFPILFGLGVQHLKDLPIKFTILNLSAQCIFLNYKLHKKTQQTQQASHIAKFSEQEID